MRKDVIRKYSLHALAVLAAVADLAAPAPAHAYTGQELSGQAKVSISRARGIALSAQAGTITDEELEKEAGGSGLRYSFDIRSGGRVHEVDVDARTGAVMENSVEGPNAD